MKRGLLVLFGIVLGIGLIGCQGDQSTKTPQEETIKTEEIQPQSEPESQPAVTLADEETRKATQQELLYNAFTAFKAKQYENAISLYKEFLENAVQTDPVEDIRGAFKRLIMAWEELGTSDYQQQLEALYARFDRLTKLPTVEAVRSEMAKVRNIFAFGSIAELKRKYPWKSIGQGLLYIDLKEGDGPIVESGNFISCYYTLWNSKGQKLQSNKGGEPFTTLIDEGKLIKGWDMAVPGMKVGGIRRLIVPGALAYSDSPPDPSIKSNETLVFEMEIQHVVK